MAHYQWRQYWSIRQRKSLVIRAGGQADRDLTVCLTQLSDIFTQLECSFDPGGKKQH